MDIREAVWEDLSGLLALYAQFGKDALSEKDERAGMIWRSILEDKNHHVIVAAQNGVLVSTCVLVVVPNLTHGGRPYGVVENVITDEKHRGKGYAAAVLNYARVIAARENCYKIMLMTGSKLDGTLKFYERAGYNGRDKTAFIQWL